MLLSRCLTEDGEILGPGRDNGHISRVFPFWEPLPPVPESWPRHLVL